MEESVNGSGGKSFGHDGVETGRMKIAGDCDAALFVGGVNQAVERLGGVLARGQNADVVDDDQVGTTDAGDDLLNGSGLCPRHS